MSDLVQRFAANQRGRDIICGDVHGCFTLLRSALVRIGFDGESGDRLFMVGDLVDRGPESIQSVEWLSQPFVHAVRGNHEDMAIRWPNGHMDGANYAANGGAWMMTLDRETQCEVSATMDSLPIAIELDTAAGLVGIVHAECPFSEWGQLTAELSAPDMSNNRRNAVIDATIWSRNRINDRNVSPVSGVRAVVVGHTPMGQSITLGNHIYIDTMGWRGGEFTLLDAATLRPAEAA